MVQLTSKYQPKRVKDFAGLARAKAIMGKLVANPYPSAWLFVGDSGTGKTTLALAVANELNAQVHHIPSGHCDKETVRNVCEACYYTPMFGNASKWHVIIIDEADAMSTAAQNAFLSKLDATTFPPDAIFIFTCNNTAKLEDRFLSRLKEIPFNGSIDAKEFGELLYSVWFDEAPIHATAPLMHKIIAESKNNVRAALNEIEMELMMVPAMPGRKSVAA